ncbi:hypothetical protein, partial [Aeromonas veronii]
LILTMPAAQAQEPPTRNQIQRQLDELAKQETLTAGQQDDQKRLNEALSTLDAITKARNKAKESAQQLRDLPTRLKSVTAELAALG